MSYLETHDMPQLDLVVKRPPEKMTLHPELGIFRSPWEAMEQLGRDYVFLVGSTIGMQWQTKDGTPVEMNDHLARTHFIPASYYPKDYVYTIKDQNPIEQHIATLNKPSPSSKKPIGDINAWIHAIREFSFEYRKWLQLRKKMK